MAGPRTRRILPPIGKNKPAGEALTEGSSTPTLIFVVFCSLIPALAQASAPAQAFAPVQTPVPGPPGLYTDADLQKATKLTLESFLRGQEHGQLQANTTP